MKLDGLEGLFWWFFYFDRWAGRVGTVLRNWIALTERSWGGAKDVGLGTMSLKRHGGIR
jgi:hypothetical protein